ncbi:MAG TPA: YggT family protein, partial [Alphaproteobacteria bacterium]|nr:YggT family protein [Alphaproteobacteria bacterium]
LNIYFYIIVIEVVVSWLLVFEVINVRNPQAQNLVRLLRKLTDPVMVPIRKYVPPIGGIDISPIIVIFLIFVLQNLIYRVFF